MGLSAVGADTLGALVGTDEEQLTVVIEAAGDGSSSMRVADRSACPGAVCVFPDSGELLAASGCDGMQVCGCRLTAEGLLEMTSDADATEAGFVDLLLSAQRQVFERCGVVLTCGVVFAGSTSSERVSRQADWLRLRRSLPRGAQPGGMVCQSQYG